MKPLILILILAASLTAAEPPKPADLPAVPVEAQLAIRTAQLQVARISDTLGRLTIQYQVLEKQHKEAQEALEKLVGALQKPADCKDCELTDALQWAKPKTEPIKEQK